MDFLFKMSRSLILEDAHFHSLQCAVCQVFHLKALNHFSSEQHVIGPFPVVISITMTQGESEERNSSEPARLGQDQSGVAHLWKCEISMYLVAWVWQSPPQLSGRSVPLSFHVFAVCFPPWQVAVFHFTLLRVAHVSVILHLYLAYYHSSFTKIETMIIIQ